MMVNAHLVWDVGGPCNAVRDRLNHHERDAPRGDDELSLSAVGLTLRTNGDGAVRCALLDPMSAPEAAAVGDERDAEAVRGRDQVDNGVGSALNRCGLSIFVTDLNPAWGSTGGTEPAAADAALHVAAEFLHGSFVRRAKAIRARRTGERARLEAHATPAEPTNPELQLRLPWKVAVFAHRLPTAFAIYPAAHRGWVAEAAPISPGSFQSLCPLPAEWAGLCGEEAASATGIEGTRFVHMQPVIRVAGSRKRSRRMARRALDLYAASVAVRARPCPC